jgi:hypothetical protein
MFFGSKVDSKGSNKMQGMSNEHIIATSIYYYDVENVTSAKISFRNEAFLDEEELQYGQSDHRGLELTFGAAEGGLQDAKAVQTLGSVLTPDGRIIAFPNTLQHKVHPFSLEDKTKPGHRRFLVLWLVDPMYRVLSTANVPPQSQQWWKDAASKTPWDLPPELSKMVFDSAAEDWLVSLEEAKRYRLDLMAERVSFTDAVERNIDDYYLCERSYHLNYRLNSELTQAD